MSNFQSQGQWENETESIILDKEHSDSLSGKVSIKIKKSSLFIIVVSFVAIVAAIIAIYSFARPIEGVWVRQADDTSNAGMIVKVSKNGSVLQGVVLDPSNSDFEADQIKWLNISKIGFGKYECSDLHSDGFSTNYVDTLSTITVFKGGNSLKIVTNSQTSNQGQFQVWIKQE